MSCARSSPRRANRSPARRTRGVRAAAATAAEEADGWGGGGRVGAGAWRCCASGAGVATSTEYEVRSSSDGGWARGGVLVLSTGAMRRSTGHTEPKVTVSAVRTADTVLAPRRRPFTKVPWLEPRSVMKQFVPLASRVSVQWRLDTASEDRSISFFGCLPILTEHPRRRSAAGRHGRPACATSPTCGMRTAARQNQGSVAEPQRQHDAKNNSSGRRRPPPAPLSSAGSPWRTSKVVIAAACDRPSRAAAVPA